MGKQSRKEHRANQAVLRNVRIAPRKARMVADLVRSKPVGEALSVLQFTAKKASNNQEKVKNSKSQKSFILRSEFLLLRRFSFQGRNSQNVQMRSAHFEILSNPRCQEIGPTRRGCHFQGSQSTAEGPKKKFPNETDRYYFFSPYTSTNRLRPSICLESKCITIIPHSGPCFNCFSDAHSRPENGSQCDR